jgi:hypothetical protein
MTIDLSGSRAKIQRAHEHRNALEGEIEPVLNGERHQIRLSAQLDPHTGYHVFRVGAMPDEWRLRVAVVLGDIVHNLRSSLDQLAWQLVLNHSGRPATDQGARQVAFPIQTDSKKLASTYTYNKVSGSDRAIIESAQPYKGPDNPKLHGLAVLQRLSNRDKHRMLNPILVGTTNFTIRGGKLESTSFDVMTFDFRAQGRNLKIGAEVVRCVVFQPVEDKVDVAGYSAPNVRLPQRPSLSLMEGIDIMLAEIDSIMADFASEYSV